MRPINFLLTLLLAGCHASDSAGPYANAQGKSFPVANAVVTGPISGGLRGHALWDSWYDLSARGYIEEEYFISGVARVQPDGAEAAYTTRILLSRPLDAARFNGTVVLDWVNVTAQFENPVDLLEAHDYLIREGYAFAHVSAQSAGICCVPQLTPKTWDPVRYMPLSHPGDNWSFDMFAQIALAIRAPIGTDPMAGLQVQRVLAAGQSQSASRLYSYVNLGYARSGVIDGFLIHGGGSKIFDEPPAVPIIHLLSDNEADPEAPGTLENYALWELAGSSHTDLHVGYHQVVGQGPRALASLPPRPASADDEMHEVTGNYGEQISPLFAACIVAGSAFPTRYAVNAALHHLAEWARTGTAAPQGPRFALDDGGALMQDAHGNTLGGIRYPMVEVPVARYASTSCPLGGMTFPFTDAELTALYTSHADYACRMHAATARSLAEGFLLPADAEQLLGRVAAAANRFTASGNRDCD